MNSIVYLLLLLSVILVYLSILIYFRKTKNDKCCKDCSYPTKYPIQVSNNFIKNLMSKNPPENQLYFKKEITDSNEEEVKISWDINKLRQKILETIPKEIYGWYHEYTSSSGNSNENAIKAYENLQYIPNYLGQNKKFSYNRDLTLSSLELGLSKINIKCPFFTVPYGVASEYGYKSNDLNTVRGIIKSGGIYTIPHLSKYTVEQFAQEIKKYDPNAFFMYQIYLTANNEVNISLIERAKAAGVSAIMFTIDVGSNNHGGIKLVEYQSTVTFTLKFANVLFNDPVFNIECYKENKCIGTKDLNILNIVSEKLNIDKQTLINSYDQTKSMDYAKHIQSIGMGKSNYNINDPEMYNWSVQNVSKICHSPVSVSSYINRQFSKGVPVIVKGCLSVQDAILSQQGGADGVYISSHGGRFLYNSVAPLSVLPDIRKAVKTIDQNFGVWIDGGIRSGADIFGAYCKGAEFVGLGRPIIYACVLYGEDGASAMQKKFMFELKSQALLCGHNDLNDYEKLKYSIF